MPMTKRAAIMVQPPICLRASLVAFRWAKTSAPPAQSKRSSQSSAAPATMAAVSRIDGDLLAAQRAVAEETAGLGLERASPRARRSALRSQRRARACGHAADLSVWRKMRVQGRRGAAGKDDPARNQLIRRGRHGKLRAWVSERIGFRRRRGAGQDHGPGDEVEPAAAVPIAAAAAASWMAAAACARRPRGCSACSTSTIMIGRRAQRALSDMSSRCPLSAVNGRRSSLGERRDAAEA